MPHLLVPGSPLLAQMLMPQNVGVVEGMARLMPVGLPLILIATLVVWFGGRELGRLGHLRPQSSGIISLTIVALLTAGLLGALLPMSNDYWFARDLVGSGLLFLVAVCVAKVRRLRRPVARVLRRVDRMTRRQQFWTAVAMVPLVAAHLTLTAWQQGRELVPMIHDELSYAVMARIFASGHLWMPAHPLTEAFETFYVYTTPVYGSMYFPGAGIVFGAFLALGLPLWVGPVMVAGAFVAMVFRLIGRLFTPSCGLAAALSLLGVTQFRWFSTHVMSHMPMALAVLCGYWAYLNWQSSHRLRYAVVFSACGAFAFITRPYDAFLLLVPAAVGVLIGLARGGVRRLAVGVALVAVSAAPFMALQVVINHAYTGQWLRTPFAAYFDRDMPNAGFGFNTTDPAVRPKSRLPQKVEFYDTFAASQMNSHTVDDAKSVTFWAGRYLMMVTGAPGYPFVLILGPLGFAVAIRSRAWFMAAAVPLLFFGYTPYPYFLAWYNTGAIAAMVLCLWAAVRPVARMIHAAPLHLRYGVTAGFMACAISCQPYWWGPGRDNILFESPMLKKAEKVLALGVRRPALVFFRFDDKAPTYASQHEPVYNWETAWPDDSGLIRVHSFDPDTDLKVLRYYRNLNGSRNVYMYDRHTETLASYGTIDQFLRHYEQAAATRPATAPNPTTRSTLP